MKKFVLMMLTMTLLFCVGSALADDDRCTSISGYHQFGAGNKPTCIQSYVCIQCGKTIKGDHEYEIKSEIEQSCSEKGAIIYECKYCEETKTEYTTDTVLPHEYEVVTVEPSCTEDGYTKYTCKTCGDSYVENKVSKFCHWYGEWTPNGDGTHTASCKRDGCKHSADVDCVTYEYTLNDAMFTVCPVCGEVLDGTRLELVEDAEAEGENLPKGELVLRKNDAFMTVGFEYTGKLTQATEPVTITLPAEVVDGYTLTILAADGTETALETTVEDETVQFTLDFGETPVVLIHMTAEA